jgi:hypothetical protein
MNTTMKFATLLILMSGCSSNDDNCGPDTAAETGIKLVGATPGDNIAFGPLKAGLNNDCPDPTAPTGVISVTIDGAQLGGAAPITFCVPRPDLLSKGPLSVGSDFQIVDVSTNEIAGCRYSLLRSTPPTGTASAIGLCKSNICPGFSLVLDVQVSLTKKCGTAPDQIVRLPLSGTTTVMPAIVCAVPN